MMALLAKAIVKQMIFKALPVGTVRDHKDGKYKKVSDDKWEKVNDSKKDIEERQTPYNFKKEHTKPESIEYLKNEFNSSNEQKYDETNPYSDLSGHHIYFTKGDVTVQTDIQETKDAVFLMDIGAKNKDNLSEKVSGSGVGSDIVNKLKEYCDKKNKTFYIPSATDNAKPYWDHFKWLKPSKVSFILNNGTTYTPRYSYVYNGGEK